jgi:glycosyltransferase involved in cell wall biosynthesis
LRVAVLAEDGELSACTRYRLLQHLPGLAERLGRIDLLGHDDLFPHSRSVPSHLAFFGRSGAAYARLALRLRRLLRGYDALLVQRGLYPLGPGLITRAVERFDGRVVFDLDDAVFLVSPALARRNGLVRWLYGPQQARRLLRRADAVVVSTDELAGLLPQGTRLAAVLPTVPDPARYPLARHVDGDRPVIGWVGTLRNLRYLELLRPALEHVHADGVARLEVVCSAPWDGPASFRRWRLEEEAAVFARYDVGVMPLPDSRYTRAKAGFKLLQFMAAGVPVIASPVGVNRMLLERSGAGFLAAGAHEWEQALRRLAASADLRREYGARGRAFVCGYADLDHHADTLAALLRGDD